MVISMLQKIFQTLTNKSFLAGIALIFITQAVYPFLPWRIEITEDQSLPYTVWLTHSGYNPIKDKYIEFPPPVHNKYTKGVKTLIKQVGCTEGQLLATNELNEYTCNGFYLGTAKTTDRQWKRVSIFKYNGTIPSGKVFATGTHPRSYDSRYFGFVDVATIERGASPLW